MSLIYNISNYDCGDKNQFTTVAQLNKWLIDVFYEKTFESQGEAFTVCIKNRYSRADDFFSKLTEKLFFDYGNGYLLYTKENIIKCSPEGSDVTISYHTNYQIITIVVPQKISAKLFESYFGGDSYAFRDRLLNSHKQVLVELTAPLIHSEPSQGKDDIYNFICIYQDLLCSAHCDLGDPNDEKYIKRFSDFGFENLGGLKAQYGMALAIIEIYKSIWASKECTNLECTFKVVHDITRGISRKGIKLVTKASRPPKPPRELKKW